MPSRRLIVLIAALLLLASCGGNKNPNQPSGGNPSPAPGPGAISVTSMTANGRGAPGNVTYKLTMRMEETGGRQVTLTSIVFDFDDGGRATLQGNNRQISASGSLTLTDITITDANPVPIARRVTATVSFTDDRNGTGTASRSSDVTVIVLVTLSGTVRDRANNAPIAGATVRVQSGESTDVRATSDAAGRYALTPIVAGAFNIFVSAPGYDGQSFPINIDRDTPFDPAISKSPPAAEYTISGTARSCDVTYTNTTGGIDQREVRIPWSYTFSSVRSGQFLSVLCQINTSSDRGSIFVSIYARGRLIQSASATGFPNIASASGSVP